MKISIDKSKISGIIKIVGNIHTTIYTYLYTHS
jgi:hypothetical protein